MGIGSILPSIHKVDGWQGQYLRMIRWYEKFKKTDPGNFENPNINEEHDVLYASFQNIFILKDWLYYSAKVSKQSLNTFINANLELQLCRDIANGTKHFDLTKASLDGDFTIIREYEPFYKALDLPRYKIIILSGGHKFELKELACKSIRLWEGYIRVNIDDSDFWSKSIVWKKGSCIPGYYAFQTDGNVAPGDDNPIRIVPHLDYPDSLLKMYK